MLPDTFVVGADDFLLEDGTEPELVGAVFASRMVAPVPVALALLPDAFDVEFVFSKNT